jgi:hypothetical protein
MAAAVTTKNSCGQTPGGFSRFDKYLSQAALVEAAGSS